MNGLGEVTVNAMRMGARDWVHLSDHAQRVRTGVELHRVAHGLCLGDALAPDINFTSAELVHHPQEGVSGFWGCFTLKPNPIYDPTDRKTGGKHVRHQNMSRDNILVYDVQVYRTPQPSMFRLASMDGCLEDSSHM